MISVRAGLVSFGSGVLFALGLGISGMTHPTKVLAFLDLAGAWDPSLALVMAGAIAVGFFAFPRALGRSVPRFGERFHLPATASIDARLIVGSVIFGVGWALAGYCPGPAIVSVVNLSAPTLTFMLAMIGGMVLFEGWELMLRRRASEARVDVTPAEASADVAVADAAR